MKRSMCAVLAAVLPAISVPAENLIQNADFDSGYTGWTGLTFPFSSTRHNAADGSGTAPSMQLESGPSPLEPTAARLWQCVDLAGVPPPWDFGVRTRVVSSTGACIPGIFVQFSNAACGQQGSTSMAAMQTAGTVAGVEGLFTQYAGTVSVDPMPGGMASKAVTLEAGVACVTSSDSMIMNVDKAYFGPTGTTPVSLQSFEVK